MSADELFQRLLRLEERMERMAPRYGLAFATVRAITDQGLELNYLTTTIDAPSAPARMAMPMAGNNRGTFFMPEVGDEVVVGFEQGDVSVPVILGSLWNDRAQVPASADTSASNNRRTIVSRAGHQITFDDTPGAGSILIRTAGNSFEINITGDSLTINSTGSIDSSRIMLDGVSWNHVHPSGTGITDSPRSKGP